MAKCPPILNICGELNHCNKITYLSHTYDVIFSFFQTDEDHGDHGDEPKPAEPATASGSIKASTSGVAVLFVGALMIA